MVPAAEPQVSERGGSYDVILQTTVTKTDNYSCVASQEEIKSKPAHILRVSQWSEHKVKFLSAPDVVMKTSAGVNMVSI
ncbi:hypothetical protein KUCAC02_035423 [Chaenocephalus aceratus]|nr:hypothetical protein KUCAC02_035423 [Chaenocephalus aceratus]